MGLVSLLEYDDPYQGRTCVDLMDKCMEQDADGVDVETLRFTSSTGTDDYKCIYIHACYIELLVRRLNTVGSAWESYKRTSVWHDDLGSY